MNPITISLASQDITFNFGQYLGHCLPTGITLLLQGNLGAGKTTFVQGLGNGLGIPDMIVSPTFALVNEYHEGRVPLYHFDLYRLEPGGVEQLNLEAYWEGNDEVLPGIVAIEWPERLTLTPETFFHINFDYGPNDSRVVTIQSHNISPSLEQEILKAILSLQGLKH